MKNLLNKKEIPTSADYTIVALNEDGNVTVKDSTPTPPQPTIEYVDLGLPSGKKWMKYNLGATSETEYGLYFQWGATEGYSDASHSDWTTAPFNNGSEKYDRSYFASVSGTVCPNGVLANEYDAVYQATNGQAHIPTQADFQELIANTNKEWVTNYEGSGINGYLFRSMTDMDKYIFIPAAGYAYYGDFGEQGSYGGVWSSFLDTYNHDSAWSLNFGSDYQDMDYGNRCSGFSVRGVLG